MSFLLSVPETVLVVGDDDTVDAASATLVPSVATAVVGAADTDEATAAVADRSDVGCVVVTDSAPEPPAAVAETIRETDDLLPIVVTAPGAACDHTALAALSDCRFLGPADDDALAVAVGAALTAFDERRRRDAESDLFRTLLDEGELAVFAKDDRGRHLYKADVEDDADPASVIGKTDREIAPAHIADEVEKDVADDEQVVETGEPIYDRVREYSHDGYDFWSRTTKVPWSRDGEVVGLVGYAVDISERKRYEQYLADQSDRIDQFIRYVAHDLRTPLQVVYGRLNLARAGDEESLDGIERGVERIESIVEDLSTLATEREASGLSSGALQSFSAGSLTTELAPLVERVWSLLPTEDATLDVAVPEGTVVAAEAKTLRPVVENLLKNALDHAGPEVTVRVGALERGVFVEDDGPGIPPDDRSAVVESGYTTAEDGTGTGLDIVADTVEQQGWDLTITDATETPEDTDAAGASEDTDRPGARFEISGLPVVTRTDFDVAPGREVALDGSEDVGPVDVAGSASYDAASDEWTVVADGTNVWGNTHEFHYVHGTATAPVRIEGEIVSLDGPEEFSKAGFAVRAGADERAPFGYVGRTQSHGSEVTWREAADGFTHSDQFGELPGTFDRYRVEYVDGLVTLWLSETGEEWLPVDQQAVDLGETVSVGLMACSHSGNQTCEVVFGDVRVVELTSE